MSNTGGDTGFDGVFGRGRGSERAHVEEVDIVVAFVGGHTKRSPELSSLCAEIGDLGRRRVFSFLVDGRGKLLGIRSAHPFPSSAQHVAFTVIGGSFKRKLLSQWRRGALANACS
jgi:hypothetical protein